ncbi:MAG TPA: hypothetical protein VE078_04905 [Thermoanaerobaculia bacterium]|nr:hypothetical protein [Thermoanaerobaculia bacterium]
MPNTDSFPDTLLDLKKLQAGLAEHAEVLSDVAVERQELDQRIEKIEGLRVQQDSLTAARQRTTQELKQEVVVTRDLAMRLRAAAKLKLGPRSELLVRFGVAPLRRRTRKATKEKPPPPPPVEAAAEAVKKPDSEAA